VFAKFLIVLIFILISIQAFQIVNVSSAFAQSYLRVECSTIGAGFFVQCHHDLPENHLAPSPPELKDETIAHPPPPELKDETHLQMPH
jgi:hypothetical protein